jgi:hypothetical protein
MMFFSEKNFYIFKVKDHKKQKEKILSKILTHKYSFDYNISKTDWNVFETNWFDFGFSDRDKDRFLKFIDNKYKKKPIILNYWFNQYEPNSGSHHALHNHPDSTIACIYYVELKTRLLRTVLVDPVTGKKVTPRANEGDLLIFKSSVFHESPKNFTNTRKTIIAFNFDLNDAL